MLVSLVCCPSQQVLALEVAKVATAADTYQLLHLIKANGQVGICLGAIFIRLCTIISAFIMVILVIG